MAKNNQVRLTVVDAIDRGALEIGIPGSDTISAGLHIAMVSGRELRPKLFVESYRKQ